MQRTYCPNSDNDCGNDIPTSTLDPQLLLLRQNPVAPSTASALSAQFNADANQELTQREYLPANGSNGSSFGAKPCDKYSDSAAFNTPTYSIETAHGLSYPSINFASHHSTQPYNYITQISDEEPWNHYYPTASPVPVPNTSERRTWSNRLDHASLPIPIILSDSPDDDRAPRNLDILATSSSYGPGSRLSAQQRWTQGSSISRSVSTGPSESAYDEFQNQGETAVADQGFGYDTDIGDLEMSIGFAEGIDECAINEFGGESTEQLLSLDGSDNLTAQSRSLQRSPDTSAWSGLESREADAVNGSQIRPLTKGSSVGVTGYQRSDSLGIDDMIDLDELFPSLVSSDRHQNDLSSSFPPTAHYFPSSPSKGLPPVSKRRPRRKTEFSMPSLPIRPKQTGPSPRKRRSSAASNPAGRQSLLSAIPEGGFDILATSPSGSRGRRSGPLSDWTAAEAAKKRSKADVCIRCRKDKASCRGDLPCERCREDKPSKWKQPCVKATFVGLVRSGPCNKLFQTSLSHTTLDRSQQLTEHFAENFDLSEMVGHLESMKRLGRNVHVCPISGSSYTIDVTFFLKFLIDIQTTHRFQSIPLSAFFTKEKAPLEPPKWLDCVKDYSTTMSTVDLLILWCNMPSRSCYSILEAGQTSPGRPLDIENHKEKSTILVIANVNRIICRAVEIAAFATLQETLNDLLTKPSKFEAHELYRLVHNLGEILCLLRWRLSWWAAFEDKDQDPSLSASDYTTRMMSLSRTLYFYFFIARTRLASSQAASIPAGTRIVYSNDDNQGYEKFPTTESADGFFLWMNYL